MVSGIGRGEAPSTRVTGVHVTAAPAARGLLGMRPPHSVDRAVSEPGWRYRELRHGHAAPITAPEQVAALLQEAACA